MIGVCACVCVRGCVCPVSPRVRVVCVCVCLGVNVSMRGVSECVTECVHLDEGVCRCKASPVAGTCGGVRVCARAPVSPRVCVCEGRVCTHVAPRSPGVRVRGFVCTQPGKGWGEAAEAPPSPGTRHLAWAGAAAAVGRCPPEAETPRRQVSGHARGGRREPG